MKDSKSQQDSIAILAEMTRRSMEKDLQIKALDNVNAHYTPRHGWHFKKKKDINPDTSAKANCWQDDYE